MQRSAKFALIAVVLVIVLGGLGFWFFVLRGDAPERAGLPQRDGTTTSIAAGQPTGADGQWVVDGTTNAGSFVGYRISELFAGDTIEVTAVGRTPGVTGNFTVAGTQLVSGTLTADLTRLASDSNRRDDAIRTQGLETSEFPEATFVVAGPVDLGGPPADGATVNLVIPGDLTLHGVTKRVEVPVAARWSGNTLDVAGGTAIVLSDFGITPISNPFVTIADTGEFEMQLVFTRAVD